MGLSIQAAEPMLLPRSLGALAALGMTLCPSGPAFSSSICELTMRPADRGRRGAHPLSPPPN